MKEFHRNNKEFIVDTNINFNCDCVTYRSHKIYFCLCPEVFENLQKAKNIHAVNDRWLKFCSWECNLKSLWFNGTMRFFKYQDIELPIHWYDRLNLFRKKPM